MVKDPEGIQSRVYFDDGQGIHQFLVTIDLNLSEGQALTEYAPLGRSVGPFPTPSPPRHGKAQPPDEDCAENAEKHCLSLQVAKIWDILP
jgi:hypothetical protein